VVLMPRAGRQSYATAWELIDNAEKEPAHGVVLVMKGRAPHGKRWRRRAGAKIRQGVESDDRREGRRLLHTRKAGAQLANADWADRRGRDTAHTARSVFLPRIPVGVQQVSPSNQLARDINGRPSSARATERSTLSVRRSRGRASGHETGWAPSTALGGTGRTKVVE